MGVPERLALLVEEGLLVLDHVLGADGGEDADLVEGVLLFLFAEVLHFDFLECVDLVVLDALDLVDGAVRSFA